MGVIVIPIVEGQTDEDYRKCLIHCHGRQIGIKPVYNGPSNDYRNIVLPPMEFIQEQINRIQVANIIGLMAVTVFAVVVGVLSFL